MHVFKSTLQVYPLAIEGLLSKNWRKDMETLITGLPWTGHITLLGWSQRDPQRDGWEP